MVAVEQVSTKHASTRQCQSVRKRQKRTEQPIRNSAVKVIAGSFAESVIRIWGEDRIGEYLGASDARRHLWHACLASEHPHFKTQSVVSCQRLYRQFKRARGKDLVAQAFGCRPLVFSLRWVDWVLQRDHLKPTGLWFGRWIMGDQAQSF
jgi:hypothetical protein